MSLVTGQLASIGNQMGTMLKEYPELREFTREKIHVLGLVERSNWYGHTADCIDSEYHRPYCYCKIQKED